ncbi:Protein of uncharacterised function (DUF461) [Mycolicibacterium aurum]|uniref:Protein of uncharacterized function (DUF461) n=1 Tax=Mycolicibacterium aurum TaxID=1791 RepID=A0A448IPL4_MYCAU|nr:hypothetical protein [Mycolicibacterium aurum]VEG54361.1 Protein of uncharacterised function (DUF461) [Mycolicibacterium aurum]
MRSTKLRRSGSVLAGTAALTMSVAGCGEDPVLDSSNRGSGSHTDDTSVENAYIVPAYVPGQCAIQLNAGGAMRFTITNNRPAETERLLGISTGAGEQARVIGSVAIPPKSAVSFGEPNAEPGAGDASGPPVLLDRLDPDLVPATSADVTFHFERAGDLTFPVPVEACPIQQR